MNKTSIDYLTHTWNPLAMRCTKVSSACDHCWHLRMANRLAGSPAMSDEARAAYRGEIGPVMTARLNNPLHRKKPAVIGVQFMGDLFHEDVPDEFISNVWQVMVEAHQHTFQVLTKRSGRMRKWVTAWYRRRCSDAIPNIWGLVTAENQEQADKRIPDLLATKFAVRGVSCEPLLSEIDLTRYIECPFCAHAHTMPSGTLDCLCGHLLDWVIAGGETGPGARPMPLSGARNLRDQCQAAGVSYFFKQHGEWLHFERRAKSSGSGYYHADNGKRLPVDEFIDKPHEVHGDFGIARVGNKAAGHLLDGREWREMPGGVK